MERAALRCPLIVIGSYLMVAMTTMWNIGAPMMGSGIILVMKKLVLGPSQIWRSTALSLILLVSTINCLITVLHWTVISWFLVLLNTKILIGMGLIVTRLQGRLIE